MPEPASETFPVVVIFSNAFPVVSASITCVAVPVVLISPPFASCLNSTRADPLNSKGVHDPVTVIVALVSNSTSIFVAPVLLNT